jgi:hypothetical protein
MLFIRLDITIENDKKLLSPIINSLINEFGSDKRVLDELSAKLHSYSTSGSAVDIFEERIELLLPLLEHQIDQVREFAKKEINEFKIYIEKEKIWLQNSSLGERSWRGM